MELLDVLLLLDVSIIISFTISSFSPPVITSLTIIELITFLGILLSNTVVSILSPVMLCNLLFNFISVRISFIDALGLFFFNSSKYFFFNSGG